PRQSPSSAIGNANTSAARAGYSKHASLKRPAAARSFAVLRKNAFRQTDFPSNSRRWREYPAGRAMNDLPETRHSLLVRLCDRSDREAWDEFAAIYEPAVYRLARGKGFQHADALDLVQEVLWGVAKAIDRWSPDAERGRFRTWLFRVARNVTVNALVR